MSKSLRGIVVGASTLLGRELVEELNASSVPWDLRLADAMGAASQILPGTDEAVLIQPLTPELFEGVDVAFFAADAKSTRAHWKEAQAAGARIVDLSYALEKEPQATVRCPWMPNAVSLKPETSLVIPAHAAAVMLSIVAAPLAAAFPGTRLAATVLEPASQQGSRALDEMHQQTISLLGLRSVPQDVYDAQVAFNLRLDVGPEAAFDTDAVAATIRRHIHAIAVGDEASAITLQLVLAPVFHGYTMSVYAQLDDRIDAGSVRRALEGGIVTVAEQAGEAPSNQSVMQQKSIAVSVRSAPDDAQESNSFWLWVAADNLKLAALEAVACAEELVEREAMSR